MSRSTNICQLVNANLYARAHGSRVIFTVYVGVVSRGFVVLWVLPFPSSKWKNLPSLVVSRVSLLNWVYGFQGNMSFAVS